MYEIVRRSVPGPNGPAWFHCREDTNDLHTAMACYQYDEYGLADLRPLATVIDLGAHIGGVTVQMGMRGVFVYAYEPIPENYELLVANVKANGLGVVVTCHCKAVTRRKRGLWLHVGGPDTWHGWIGSEFRKGGDARHVLGVSLNMVLKQDHIEHVDVLKMDVEGSEWDVIGGASLATLRKIDRIVGETHGVNDGAPCNGRERLLEATRGLFEDRSPADRPAEFNFVRK